MSILVGRISFMGKNKSGINERLLQTKSIVEATFSFFFARGEHEAHSF